MSFLRSFWHYWRYQGCSIRASFILARIEVINASLAKTFIASNIERKDSCERCGLYLLCMCDKD